MNGTEAGIFTLQVENANLRSRCEELEATIDRLMADINRKVELAGALRCTIARHRNERDEQKALAGHICTRYDNLEAELANLRSRCEELMQQNQAAEWWKRESVQMKTERDEARQWARKYKLAYEKQWKATSYHRREGLDWLSWGQEMDKILKGLRAVNAALRAQLAEARNKALEDVVSVVRNMNFELSNREGLVKRIRDLLDSS